jgi:LAGLIDADG DNA endonuclease family
MGFSPIVLGKYNSSKPLLEEVLVGVLLGDGWLEKQKINARFRFEQSHVRSEFFFHLFEYFAPFCSNSPKLRERYDKRTNKTYKT